jgi:hypothetical protein
LKKEIEKEFTSHIHGLPELVLWCEMDIFLKVIYRVNEIPRKIPM